MSQRRSIQHLIAVIAIFSMLLTAVQVTPAVASPVPQGKGGNPVNPTDAPLAPVSTKATKPVLDLNKIVRVIVQLKDPALASYTGGISTLSATSPKTLGTPRLQVDSPSSTAYIQYLVTQQAAAQSALAAALPTAKVERSYQVVLNGFTVSNVKVSDLAKIQAMPGVKAVTIEREFQTEMDASIPLIGLGTGNLGETDWTDAGLWNTLGGHAVAGKGIKIADIDTGITLSNPCFNPAGFSYPAGFPKFGTGYGAYVDPKVIAARAYFRPDDPPFYAATPIDDPGSGGGGHGTHTAGTMVCDYGTQTPYGAKISGVAPAAQLMVYRVFYLSLAGSESAYDPELIAAVEDAVKDGADVVNNSWGGTFIADGKDDPLANAYEAAVDAGVVVVFAAGNAGPNAMTVGSPGGSSDKFITVAASTTARTFDATLTFVSVTKSGPTPVPAVATITGRSVAAHSVTAPIVDLAVEGYADTIGCIGSIPTSIAKGKIVVIRRGTCALVDKVTHAAAGGALGVVIRNVSGGATTLPLINPVLPTVHISQADGDALAAYLGTVKTATASATFTINTPVQKVNADTPDLLADFSSRGPTPDLGFTPDITAPGVNILSSVSPAELGATTPTFDFYQGTSMATPHVTASAALMRQAHPDWTPAQIKSALMSTAAEPAALGLNPTNRGSGRLNLTAPDKVGVTFDQPGVSFGLVPFSGVPATDKKSITITATNMTAKAITYKVAVVQTSAAADTVVVQKGGVTITTLSVAAHGTATFNLVLTPLGTGQGYGEITFTDQATTGATPALHLPYWDRKVTAVTGKDFLLINDEGMANTGCSTQDFQSIYTTALNALGKTFDVVNTDTTAIDWNMARQYTGGIIYFQSNINCTNAALNAGTNPNSLRNYVVSGGKILAMGQDIMYTDYLAGLGAFGPSYTSVLPDLVFGAQFVQDDLFRSADPSPAVVGDKTYSSFLSLFAIGLDQTNPLAVDEVQAPFYTDIDTLPILSSVPLGTALVSGTVGTRSSVEPTLERVLGTQPWTRGLQRGELVSFGLQDMVDGSLAPILNTRAQLLSRLTNWLGDQAAIDFTSPTYFTASPSVAVAFNATTTSSLGSVLQCRFTFGDGSDIVTVSPVGGVCSVNHKFPGFGVYKAYAEVLDSYGHKAVSSPVMAQVGMMTFLPLVTN